MNVIQGNCSFDLDATHSLKALAMWATSKVRNSIDLDHSYLIINPRMMNMDKEVIQENYIFDLDALSL